MNDNSQYDPQFNNLDSGSGRELSEFCETFANVQRMNPDGAYTCPVSLYPENWFVLRDTSSKPVEQLENPADLAQKMSALITRQNNIINTINTLLAVILANEAVSALKDACEAADSAFNLALDSLTKGQISASTDMIKTFIDIVSAASPENKPDDVPEATTARIFKINVSDVKKAVALLTDSVPKCIDVQSKLTSAAQKATSAAITYFEQKNLLQFKTMLIPLQSELQSTNDAIAELRQNIKLAITMQSQE